MHKFVRALLTEWRKLNLPVADAAFVVAVSGGADSIGLATALDELRRLKKLNLRLVVAHFNHELRGAESDADELFVRDFAERFDFELACGKRQNSQARIENKIGNLEQNARLARYNFLLETARNLRAFAVLTAHTQNDQAETFLLNLIRGSGLEGLGGIKAVRNFSHAEFENDSTLVERQSPEKINEDDAQATADERAEPVIVLARPLLDWATRERTENFCLENEIEFRFDSMNDDLAYRRVRIRKVLLPMLADFNPKIVETLSKTANLLRADYGELKTAADTARGNFQTEAPGDENVLELKELKNLFPSMRRQILREWLRARRGNLRRLDSKHIEAIERLIESRRSGRRVELPGGETIAKSGGRLLFERATVEKTRSDNYNQGLKSSGAPNAIENND